MHHVRTNGAYSEYVTWVYDGIAIVRGVRCNKPRQIDTTIYAQYAIYDNKIYYNHMLYTVEKYMRILKLVH